VAEQSHSDDELRKRISELKKQVASLQRRVQALQDELEREIEDGNEQAKLVMQLVAEVRALRGEGSDGSES
jgi:predicted transcriptional regulator